MLHLCCGLNNWNNFRVVADANDLIQKIFTQIKTDTKSPNSCEAMDEVTLGNDNVFLCRS